MSEATDQDLLPAEHRALRELFAMARRLCTHWDRLGDRLGGEAAAPLAAGAASARELLGELSGHTAAHGLHGFPAAQGAGGGLGNLRNVAGDLMLERNQALRVAVLDVAHVTTLLAYLSALADHRGDAMLAAWHRRWEARMRDAQDAALAAVVALAADPDAAVLPASPTALGRAGAGIGKSIGAVGEAVDGSAIGRAARRLGRS